FSETNKATCSLFITSQIPSQAIITNVEQEEKRIQKAGGKITKFGNDVPRVESKLAVSRALG
ncbi:unnamed protein product, partial [Rotaria sp. Silwood2]